MRRGKAGADKPGIVGLAGGVGYAPRVCVGTCEPQNRRRIGGETTAGADKGAQDAKLVPVGRNVAQVVRTVVTPWRYQIDGLAEIAVKGGNIIGPLQWLDRFWSDACRAD